MSFKNFKSSAIESRILAAGSHIVTIVRIILTNSFESWDRDLQKFVDKSDSYIWDSPTGQLFVEFEDPDGKRISARVNDSGYAKEDDYAPESLEEEGLTVKEGFVCRELDNGKFQRILSDERTEKAYAIVNKLLNAAGMPEGSDIETFMSTAVAEKLTLGIRVAERIHKEKKYHDVKAYFKPEDIIKAAAPAQGTMEL